MQHSKSYLITRAIVRGIFWTGAIVLGLIAFQWFVLALWSLQFPY